MQRTTQLMLLLGSILVIGAVVGACASKSYIDVKYRLPIASDDLKGKRVFLECRDVRSDKTIFGPNAQTEFKNFTGLFSLSVDQGKKPFVAGAFDLTSLFKEAFKRKFENSGLDVVTQQEKTIPVLEIVIKEFRLDLVDRKWVAAIKYEARLLKGDLLLVTKTISGDAERSKIIGQGDAEKVLGEIFTEIVNQLDVHKLFEQTTKS
jgi:uncharacterized lipoprotein YajG